MSAPDSVQQIRAIAARWAETLLADAFIANGGPSADRGARWMTYSLYRLAARSYDLLLDGVIIGSVVREVSVSVRQQVMQFEQVVVQARADKGFC